MAQKDSTARASSYNHNGKNSIAVSGAFQDTPYIVYKWTKVCNQELILRARLQKVG